jgi:hypothetical protein
MAQLEIETAQEEEVPEELTEKLKRLTIEVDIRATWVKSWGHYNKNEFLQQLKSVAKGKKCVAKTYSQRFSRRGL